MLYATRKPAECNLKDRLAVCDEAGFMQQTMRLAVSLGLQV